MIYANALKREYQTELGRIMNRLDESAGRRIARRNALRDLDTLLRRIRKDLRKRYPSISKEGKEIVPTVLPRGERKCPTDGAYVPTPGAFAKHVVTKHDAKCWCGFVPSWSEKVQLSYSSTATKKVRVKYDRLRHSVKYHAKAVASLRGHFARVKDNLTSHLVYGSIKQLSAEETT